MSAEGQPQAQFSIEPSDLPASEFVYKFGPEVCNRKPKPKLLRITEEDKQSGCHYCYVFEDYDPTVKPSVMDSDRIVKYAERVAEHADARKLKVVRVIMHGGEVMLYPKKVDEAATAMRAMVESDELGLSIVTNGTIPLEKHVAMLKKHDIGVGVSIDGGRAAHFRHRRGPNGEDDYDHILHTVGVLRRSGLRWGILGVIDPRNDPEQVVEDLAALKPHSISLFPSLIRNPEAENAPGAMSIGQWQIRAYRRYRDWERVHPEDAEPPFTMPRYDDYAAVFAGYPAEQQNVAGRPWQEMFMNPEGWGRIDTLAPGARGVHMTAFNPNDHSVDYVLANDPGYIAQRGGRGTLPPDCRTCPLVDACGADYHPHRGNKVKLAKLTQNSTPMDFVEAYSDVSPLCSDQKEFLPVIAEAVEAELGWPKGLLTGQVEMPDDISALEPVPTIAEASVPRIEVPDDLSNLVGPVEVAQPAGPELVAVDRREALADRAPRAVVSSSYRLRVQKEMLERLRATVSVETMAWLEKGCPSYESFPLGGKREVWELPRKSVTEVLGLVNSGALHGRFAAYAYQASCIRHEGRPISVAFHSMPGSPSELVMARPDRRAPDDYVVHHFHFNDAIVTSLLDKRQPALRDVPFKLAKVNGYWLVTGDAVRALAPQAANVSGSLIAKHTNGGDDYEVYRPLSRDGTRIKVGFADLPPDMLVLETPGAASAESLRMFDEAVEAFSLFSNPEEMSKALSKRSQPTFLRPLSGPWPSAYHGEHWTKRKTTYLLGVS